VCVNVCVCECMLARVHVTALYVTNVCVCVRERACSCDGATLYVTNMCLYVCACICACVCVCMCMIARDMWCGFGQ